MCVGGCVCVCVLGGRAFVWDGVGCFCCLKNPGNDKPMLMISYVMHLHFNAFMTSFLILYSYWGSPLLRVL